MKAEKIASYIVILIGGAILASFALRIFFAHANLIFWLGVGLCVAFLGYYVIYYWTEFDL